MTIASLTIRELLKTDPDLIEDGEYPIYSVSDHEHTVIFYVGQSKNSLRRLFDHLGIKKPNKQSQFKGQPSTLGQLILDCRPESLNWLIFLWPLTAIQEHLALFDLPTIDEAEHLLIAHLRPCLNKADNPNPAPLPQRYLFYQANQQFMQQIIQIYTISRFSLMASCFLYIYSLLGLILIKPITQERGLFLLGGIILLIFLIWKFRYETKRFWSSSFPNVPNTPNSQTQNQEHDSRQSVIRITLPEEEALITEHEMKYAHFDVRPETLCQFARDMLDGKYTLTGSRLSRRHYERLRNECLAKGLLAWKNPDGHSQGVEITNTGRCAFQEMIDWISERTDKGIKHGT